jgi:hypothetical protein
MIQQHDGSRVAGTVGHGVAVKTGQFARAWIIAAAALFVIAAIHSAILQQAIADRGGPQADGDLFRHGYGLLAAS